MKNCKLDKISNNIINLAVKKAVKLSVNHKVSAIGYNDKFEMLGISTNCYKIRGGPSFKGIHAEQNLIRRYGNKLKYIFIIRVNQNGKLLPIDPCENCKALAQKYNIKIISYH